MLIFRKVTMAAVYLCSSCRVCSSSPLTFSSSSVLLCKNEFISAKINALALTLTRNKRETITTLNNFTSVLPHSTKQLLRCTSVPGPLALLISAMPRDWFAWKIQPPTTFFVGLSWKKEEKIFFTGNLDWSHFSAIYKELSWWIDLLLLSVRTVLGKRGPYKDDWGSIFPSTAWEN